jgi:ABC-type Fe3+ transport system substrate-binding protein
VPRDWFEARWQDKHGTGSSPIVESAELALTPMVFVMWKDRHEAFTKNFPELTFTNLAEAMHRDGGWSSLAGQAEWGNFKFGHTNPAESNSGLISMVLMAYDYHQKKTDLTVGDVTGADFQEWLRRFELGLNQPTGELIHSTGTMMDLMISRGPSYFDAVMVYENLALGKMRQAQGRWGDLVVGYPTRNIWNSHPYYILDVPWSSADQRVAAKEFLDFLLSEPIQRRALDFGFRPGNPAVPINEPDSPFVRYRDSGFRIDVLPDCQPPKSRVVEELLNFSRRVGA